MRGVSPETSDSARGICKEWTCRVADPRSPKRRKRPTQTATRWTHPDGGIADLEGYAASPCGDVNARQKDGRIEVRQEQGVLPSKLGILEHPRGGRRPFAAPSRSSTADRVGTFRSDAAATDAPAAPSCCVSSKPLSIGKYLSVPRRRRGVTSRKDSGPSDLPVVPGCALVRSPGDMCPHLLEGVLNAVAKKWSVPIVGTLANHGRLRYTELQKRLGSISPKTLAARLRELERAGLLVRSAHAEIPPGVEYQLTAAGEEFWRSATPSSPGRQGATISPRVMQNVGSLLSRPKPHRSGSAENAATIVRNTRDRDG